MIDKMLKNKKILSFITIVLFFISAGLLAFSALNVKAAMTYHLLTDANGLRWQYGYDPSTRELQVSFFSGSATQITIPTAAYIKNQDSSIGTVSKYSFVSYTSHGLGTPSTFTSTITKLDLSSADNVTGVAPLLNNNTSTVVEVVLNSTASTIGYDVFRGKRLNIKNLDKATSIGGGAFYNVTFSNTTISLPSLTFLGDGSFELSNITSLTVNVPSIGISAFKSCTGLTTVTLGNNVTTIGASAFEGDTSLVNFTFNNGLTTIGNRAFKDCTSYNVNIGSTNVSSLGSEAFSGCTSLTSISIPSEVNVLKYRAFYHAGLTSVTLNNKLYDIQEQVFEGCSLTSIDLKNVERIWWRAFAINNLTELYLPKSIKVLGLSQTFYSNPIRKITVAYDTLISNGTVPLWIILHGDYSSSDAVYNTNNCVEEIVYIAPYGQNEVIDLSNHLGLTLTRNYGYTENLGEMSVTDYKNVINCKHMYNLPNLKKVTIGEGYEFLGAHNFAHNYNGILEEVILPSTLKGIGLEAFQHANRNTSAFTINLPNSLEYIGVRAFQYSNTVDLTIDLPNLKRLSEYAFEYSNIIKIFLRDSLTYIGFHSFDECNKLKDITYDCDFFSIVSNKSAFPGEHFKAYEQNSDGRYNTNSPIPLNKIKFTEKVVTAPLSTQGMFHHVNIKEIDLEDVPWTSFGSTTNQFSFAQIETLKLPKTLQAITYGMFYESRIENPIELPVGIKTIGDSAFMSSNIIASNNLPNGLQTIGYGAFMDCLFNDNIVVPASVQSISFSAFNGLRSGGIYPDLHRSSITFNTYPSALENISQISELLYYSSVDEIIFGDNMTTLPSYSYNSEHGFNESISDFARLNVKKVTFKNLTELPIKAFIENQYIEEVDFSQDPNLTKIGSHAFFNASNLSTVKLYHDLDLTIESHAFYGTALTSLNDANGIDLKNDTITLSGDCAFQEMDGITSLEISSNLNNGVIPEGTFSDQANLEEVIIEAGVTNIKMGAFENDSNLKTFVMFGSSNIDNKDGTQTINLQSETRGSGVLFYSLEELSNPFTIDANGTTITNSNLVYNTTTERYEYNYTGSGTITTSSPIVMEKSLLGDRIEIIDRDNYNMTIPSSANLYCYSTNANCNTWNETYSDYKDDEESDLYYLDEVIYLDANMATVTLTEDQEDFEKEGLVVYALRRDGVILESSEWGVVTESAKYVDSGITIRDYDANTTNPALMVFNNSAAIENIDISTNDNFSNIDYEIGEPDPETGEASLTLVYTNIITDSQPTTIINTESPTTVDIVYADGCGGEAFANVIFENVPIGDPTPQFEGTPTREGYNFIGWDKEIAETATESVIYVAQWEEIIVEEPIIEKDPDPQPDYGTGLVNPPTGASYILLFMIVTLLSYITIKKKKYSN